MNEAMKGHTFAEVSKKKAQKLFTDAGLLERVMSVLNNDGKVFAIHEKKDLVCYYIFDRVKIVREDDAAESNDEQHDDIKSMELVDSKENSKEAYAYQLIEEYWKPEKEHLREVVENMIRQQLKEYIAWGMAVEVIWNEDVYVLEKGKKKAFSIAGIAIGVMIGMSFGYSLDNKAVSIPMMMMWAMIFNMLFTIEDRKLVKKEEQDAITQ